MAEDNRFRFYTAPVALLTGWKLLRSSATLRKLAVRPILVGMITCGILLCFAPTAIESVYGSTASSDDSLWSRIVPILALISAIVVVFISITFFSLLSMLLFAGYYQSELSRETLVLLNYPVPPPIDSVGSTSREILRITIGEIGKAIFLVPTYLFLFIAGFFPPFAPFAFIIGSWLFAFQWFDYALDACRKGLFRRLTWGFAHPLLYLFFGAPLLLIATIPFAGILLAPAFVVSAAAVYSDIERP